MEYCGGSWLDLGREALRGNVEAVKAGTGCGSPIAVVKADAYGHGLEGMARELRAAGVRRFAVAYVAEGAEVRRAVPDAELIFLLGRAEAGDVEALRKWGITAAVVDEAHAEELSAAAVADGGGAVPVHIKFDTGMGRLGFVWPKKREEALRAARLPGLYVAGACMHFAKVEPESDPEWAARQHAKFVEAAGALEEALGRRIFKHSSATRAALLLEEAGWDAVRVGISLYGYETAGVPGGRFVTRPVMQWKTRVVQVKRVPAGFHAGYDGTWTAERETVLATLSVGYADGYRRSFGNRADVLLGGRRCRVAGRVSMNWLIVDAGADAQVKVGDEAVLMGEQGGEAVWADELAALDGTISYEILTGLSRQLERRWV